MAKIDKLVFEVDSETLKMLIGKLSEMDARITSLSGQVMLLQSQVSSK